MKQPIVIGITGGIGGGKTTFSRHLAHCGELVYDTDLEAKVLQNTNESLIEKIKEHFGADIYNLSGLNRAKLAKIVFNNPEKLQVLNSIVHPAVIDDLKRWIKEHSDRKFLFMESAILFEVNLNTLMDKIVVITAPEDVRIARVMKRDGLDEESVRARIRNQMPEIDKIEKADWVFDTDNDILPSQRVDKFLKMINSIYP
ncbi:MAG TPA: dephospho-CoA kinase [Bacteroidales bacterium]|nr:dephospho-CoA kinase [Bacteroidales bacterium]